MNNEMMENYGSVKISDEVISVIAGLATTEIDGVYSMGGSIASGIAEFLGGKKNISRGIKVDLTENSVSVDIHIIINYGVSIPDIATTVQEKVKDALESMTGLSVDKINVFIDGVNIEKDTEEPVLTEEETEEE